MYKAVDFKRKKGLKGFRKMRKTKWNKVSGKKKTNEDNIQGNRNEENHRF